MPFAAAPRERNPRVWIGIGVLATLLVLCCGGGVAGVFGFGVYQQKQISHAADTFLVAVEHRQYARAYQLQCDQARQQESESEFVGRLRNQPRLVSHELSTPQAYQGSAYEVPASLRYADGQVQHAEIIVVTTSTGGGWRVCGMPR